MADPVCHAGGVSVLRRHVRVMLPPGCTPPRNGMGRRLAVGRGISADMATFLSLAEAAERYSLQYSEERPSHFAPIATVGGTVETIEFAKIALGVPGAAQRVTSIGAAAGDSLTDAAARAVLELLEHHHVRAFEADRRHLPAAGMDGVTAIGGHREWLHGQLRRLDFRARWFAPGYWIALCRCCDLDGGRPTLGSAAGTDRDRTMTAAAEEAIFHWRNMVALEMNGVPVLSMAGPERAAFERYRGAAPYRWRTGRDGRVPAVERVASQPDLAELMQALGRLSGMRLRLFDLTLPDVGVPVVKCCLG